MSCPKQIIIDKALCDGCKKCVGVCPHDTLGMNENTAVLIKESCFMCGHCAGVCPQNAIIVPGCDESLAQFSTFSTPKGVLSESDGDISGLVHLMQFRRSCRNYKKKDVPHAVLEDLVKIGITAPSGSNSQKWTFSILPKREDVEAFATKIAGFYEKLNRLSEKVLLRKFLKLIGKKELDAYYNDHYPSVKRALTDWKAHGRDLLFHGAPAVILVGSKKGASCPGEDAMLATQNMLLAAHAMGLGTCLIGFASIAMERDKKIQASLDIHGDETIYSVIALGYPAVSFKRKCGRRSVPIRFIQRGEG